jgi:hypothetical protein
VACPYLIALNRFGSDVLSKHAINSPDIGLECKLSKKRKAAAELLTEAGMKCLLTARNKEKLDRLAERLVVCGLWLGTAHGNLGALFSIHTLSLGTPAETCKSIMVCQKEYPGLRPITSA